MTAKICILTLAMLLCSTFCRAEDVCPWVNTATVINAPDPAVSDAQSVVTNSGNTCAFQYRKAGILYSVQIMIHTMAGNGRDAISNEMRCNSDGAPLTGIGNEAVLCSSSTRGERIVGRVRDKIFAVDISVKTARISTETRKSLGDMATMIAEQVAGNLF